jgi:hypothetical protein
VAAPDDSVPVEREPAAPVPDDCSVAASGDHSALVVRLVDSPERDDSRDFPLPAAAAQDVQVHSLPALHPVDFRADSRLPVAARPVATEQQHSPAARLLLRDYWASGPTLPVLVWGLAVLDAAP